MAKIAPILACNFRSRGFFNRILKIAEAGDKSPIRRGEQGHVLARASQENPVLDNFNRQFSLEERLRQLFISRAKRELHTRAARQQMADVGDVLRQALRLPRR